VSIVEEKKRNEQLISSISVAASLFMVYLL